MEVPDSRSGPGESAMLARMTLILLVAMTITGSLAGGQTITAPPAGYEELIRQTRAAIGRGDTAGALELLDQALRINAEGADLYLLMGEVYRNQLRHVESAEAFKRAAALLGERTAAGQDALCEMAAALAGAEQNVEAIETLQRVLSLAPRRIGLHRDIGEIELALGHLTAAAEQFRAEIALHEGLGSDRALTDTYAMLGVTAYRQGDDETALTFLSKAPDTVDNRYHLGLTLARRGRNEEAAAALREVLKREPNHRGALQSLARVTGALGLADERREALEKFASLYKEEEETQALAIRVKDLRASADRKVAAGDLPGAVTVLADASKAAPDDLDLLLDLGRLQSTAGDKGTAEGIFRQVVQRDPLRAEGWYRLGRLLADTGRLLEAIAALEKATQIVPLSTSYHVALAQIYLRTNRAQDAVRELRLARRLNPKDPDGAFNLGLGLAQAGAMPEALTELEDAQRLGYKEPVIHQVLSRIYTALGDTARAAKEQQLFESAARTKP